MSELEVNHDRIGDFRNLALSCRPGQLQMTVATGWTPDGYQGAQGAHDACVGDRQAVEARRAVNALVRLVRETIE